MRPPGRTVENRNDFRIFRRKTSWFATWEESVRQYLVKEAYSVTYGARNLRRTIQQKLEDPISEKIIDSFESPISAISIRVEEDRIVVDAQ